MTLPTSQRSDANSCEYPLSSFHLTRSNNRGDCEVIKVKKAVPTICSLDLEFNQFQVNCEDGKNGLEVKEDVLCGDLTGQTVTLAFDKDELLEIRLAGMMSNGEDYNVTVRQIDCPDSNSAAQELDGTAASAPVYTQFQDFTARIVSARLGQEKQRTGTYRQKP